ncbi:MAG: glucose-6-phosphate isomerase [Clostridiales bacterium]|nr:glucose-6-phosphate isomerase [Clostridiales bacterium]
MRIRIDYTNMLESAVGAKGIPESELALYPERGRAALEGLRAKRDVIRWRDLPYNQKEIVAKIKAVAEKVRESAEYFVVLGIGGSALGPIAVQQALNHPRYNELPREKRNGPKLYVEDNVDPERMAALMDVIEPEKTVFNVITKSGSTSETMAQLLTVMRLLIDLYGEDALKERLIATTDREKGNLIGIAKKYGLTTFCVPEGVGGRFSEMCPVGLLPAAVCGIDIEAMLDGAAYMDKLCDSDNVFENPALMYALLETSAMKLGANIGVLMPYADSLKYFSDWYAQLWAESLGKKRGEARFGQTPVKALGVTDQHSQVQLYTDGPFDKTVTFLGVENYRTVFTIPHAVDENPNVAFLSGHTFNELISAERRATEHAVTVSGHMNKTILLPEVNANTIGQLMMLFELATAYAGEILGINAYDQPGVEEGKNMTYALLGKKGYEAKLGEMKENSARRTV